MAFVERPGLGASRPLARFQFPLDTEAFSRCQGVSSKGPRRSSAFKTVGTTSLKLLDTGRRLRRWKWDFTQKIKTPQGGTYSSLRRHGLCRAARPWGLSTSRAIPVPPGYRSLLPVSRSFFEGAEEILGLQDRRDDLPETRRRLSCRIREERPPSINSSPVR